MYFDKISENNFEIKKLDVSKISSEGHHLNFCFNVQIEIQDETDINMLPSLKLIC